MRRNNTSGELMKAYKTVIIAIALPAILYSFIGNIYVFLFTYRELKNRIKGQYNEELTVYGYSFDNKNDVYTFFVEDADGMNASFSYDGKSNAFTDGYGHILSRVTYYTLRGDLLKKIKKSGMIPQDVDVYYDSKTKSVCVTVEDGDKNEFCEFSESLIRALDDENINNIIVRSDSFTLTVTDGMMPRDRNGLLSKIRVNYG